MNIFMYVDIDKLYVNMIILYVCMLFDIGVSEKF